MKAIPLHTKNTAIVYKNALCSSATIIVLIFVVLSVMIPLLLVSLLSPYSGISESRILFEQPHVFFKFQNLFIAQTQMATNGEDAAALIQEKQGLVVCSTFSSLNERLQEYTQHCESTQYWTEDFDRDSTIDRAHFKLQLEAMPAHIESFDLVLFFEAKLKHKCLLSPPAMLAHQLLIPMSAQLGNSGTVLIKAELQLKQNIEFTCPFPGRNTKTHFRDIELSLNDTSDLQDFQMESLLQKLKTNPAYFQLDVYETYFRRDFSEGLRVQLELNILQVPARYHLSVWERLGQFWLYFASFFGISFYIMNKIKDFLFGRHIIRAWEIIPWKKLY